MPSIFILAFKERKAKRLGWSGTHHLIDPLIDNPVSQSSFGGLLETTNSQIRMVKVAENWKKLSLSEKAVFNEQAKQAIDKYGLVRLTMEDLKYSLYA